LTAKYQHLEVERTA